MGHDTTLMALLLIMMGNITYYFGTKKLDESSNSQLFDVFFLTKIFYTFIIEMLPELLKCQQSKPRHSGNDKTHHYLGFIYVELVDPRCLIS